MTDILPQPSKKPFSDLKLAKNFNQLAGNLLVIFAILLLIGSAILMMKTVNNLPNAPIHIESSGLTTEQMRQLQTALGTQANANVLNADITTYLQQAKQFSWVEQVNVHRDWYKGLNFVVIPRRPVARFGMDKLVDGSGVVYTPASLDELNGKHWRILQGDEDKVNLMMQQTQQVSQWFAPLGLQIEEVVLTPRMTWLFRFNNGLRVLVDKQDTASKLYQASLILQKQLRSRLPHMQSIDLRYQNGMAITWRPVNQ